MVKVDRPGDPRAILLGFDSWLVRVLTKYSIFILALHSLPLMGVIIENPGSKGGSHLSVGPPFHLLKCLTPGTEGQGNVSEQMV